MTTAVGSRADALGGWAWLAIGVAAATVFVADANRFLPPVHDKYADSIGGGGSDLIPSFQAAWALLDGVNPYHSDPRKYFDPYMLSRGGAENVSYLYPPTHILVYLPLAWLAGRDFALAARLQFGLSLIVLSLLCAAWFELLSAITTVSLELRLALTIIAGFVLGQNPGNQLGLERGQSDLITAALGWWAVVCLGRGRVAGAAFLAVASALLKGYGAALAAGILLLGASRTHWRATLFGASSALILLLAPVARFLPDALAVYPIRARMFWNAWNNQSVYALGFHLQPSAARALHLAALALATSAAVLAWLRLRALVFSRPPADPTRAFASCVFATSALVLVLAFAKNSIAYNAVLVLPGALLIAAAQAPAPRFGGWLQGAWLTLTLFLLCAFDWPRLLGRTTVAPALPLHALGIVCLSAWVLFASARALRNHERPTP